MLGIAVVNALAFLLTGVLLERLVAGERERARVHVLWTLNPLMLWQLVAGVHTDGLAVGLGVAALLAVRRSALLAGALLGAAVSTKVTMGLLVLALVWAARRSPRTLGPGALGAALVVVPGYAWYGWAALRATVDRGQDTSRASPWSLFGRQVRGVLSADEVRTVVVVGSVLLFVALVAVLLRRLPSTASGDLVGQAVPVALALTLAFVFASPVQYPWYDAAVWPLLALLLPGPLDLVVLARTSVLTVAYLPGRVVPVQPEWLDTVLDSLRAQAAPLALAVLTVLLVLSVQPGGRPAQVGTGASGRSPVTR